MNPLSPPLSPKNNPNKFKKNNEKSDPIDYFIYELIENNEDIEDLYKYLTRFLDKDSNQKNLQIISSLITVPSLVLSERGYTNRKNNVSVKLKHRGNAINVNCKFVDNPEKIEKSTKELDKDLSLTLLSTYDFSNLPTDIAELLANGCVLFESTIENRLKWMSISNYEFKAKIRTTEQSNSVVSQLTVLVDDLINYWKSDYVVGWQVLVRCFLIGFVMNSYQDTAKSKNKTKSKNKIKKSTKSEFVEANSSKITKCTNMIMKCNDILSEVNNVVDELTKSVNQETDSHAVMSKRYLSSAIKEKLKFSYLLFCFVNMFGYVALISPTTPDIKKLLNILKLTNLEEIKNKFDYLSKTDLGKDIIIKNEKHGRNIFNTIIKISSELKIINGTMKNSLDYLVNNYMFRCNCYGNFQNNNLNNLMHIQSEIQSLSSQNYYSRNPIIENHQNSFSPFTNYSNPNQINSSQQFQPQKSNSTHSYNQGQSNLNYQEMMSFMNKNQEIPNINSQNLYNITGQNNTNKLTDSNQFNNNRSQNSNYNSIPDMQVFNNENTGLTYTVNTIPSNSTVSHYHDNFVKFGTYNFQSNNQQQSIISQKEKEIMMTTIKNSEKGLNNLALDLINKSAINNVSQYNNFSEEEAFLISYFNSMKEFVESNRLEIMVDERREQLILDKEDFTNFENNDNQRNIYNEIYNKLIDDANKIENDPMHFRSQLDNELIFFELTKNICINECANFYDNVVDDMSEDSNDNR